MFIQFSLKRFLNLFRTLLMEQSGINQTFVFFCASYVCKVTNKSSLKVNLNTNKFELMKVKRGESTLCEKQL
jgi:hypothetical protein